MISPPWRELLRMVEKSGLTGTWRWTLATNEQVWSEGLYRILGLTPGDVSPGYALLHALVHPDDRPAVATAGEIAQGICPSEGMFRIIRPDGSGRTVAIRSEITFSPEGRPLQAFGVLIDVSDREALVRAQAAEHRRRRAIFEQARAFTSTTYRYPYIDFSPEWLELIGLPKSELLHEPTLPVVQDERRHWRDHGRELYLTQQLVNTMPRLRLADGQVVRYRMVMVPMLDAQGGVEGWANYVGALEAPARASGELLRGLEQRVEGRHLRAARGLLGWTMRDLASASGLSFSTVRRLEDGGEALIARSRNAAIAALRGGGIRFSLLEGANIAIARVG